MMTTIERIYKAFQENPTRLTYSTSKLQSQYSAIEEEVKRAKKLYRLFPDDFVVAKAFELDNTLHEEFYIPDQSCIPESCRTVTQLQIKGDYTDLKKKIVKESLDISEENEWEVKTKWVKTKGESKFMVRKTPEVDYKKEFEEFVKQYKPKSVKYNTPEVSGDNLAVVCMFDMHLGKIAHLNYTNNMDNIYIQEEKYEDEFQKLLWFVRSQNVERILLPIGNDLFNVDNPYLTTVKGTPQDNTKDLHRVFRTGIDLLTLSIDALSEIAPVDVVLVPGNHASTTETYLALSLEAIYQDNPNVTVDSNPTGRKYYPYGKNLIGLAHGELPLKKYAELLPFEAKKYFAEADHIEILVGDKHVEEIFKSPVLDGDGVTVRRLAALTKTDQWHYTQGYTLSKRRSYVLLYNSKDGITMQYTNRCN